jgi:hypothetical protein
VDPEIRLVKPQSIFLNAKREIRDAMLSKSIAANLLEMQKYNVISLYTEVTAQDGD